MCESTEDGLSAMKKLLMLAVVGLLMSGPAMRSVAQAGQRDLLAFSARVQLDVSARQEIERKVTGYLTREFRLLGDVALVETNPEWVLSVIAAELENESGDKTGMILSVTLLAPFDAGFFKEYVIPGCVQSGPRLKNFIDINLADLYQLRDHWVEVGPDLANVCNSLVENFSKRHLDDKRRIWQSVLEDLQKQK